MRNFFGNLREKYYRWMQGRYGNDQFGRFLTILAIIFLVISFFNKLWSPLRISYYLAVVCIVYTLFRNFSKNIPKRQAELNFYLKTKAKFFKFLNLQKRKWNERKTHCFYKCPNCKTTIRVPKGRGRIEISCPKCRTTFIKKT